MLCSVPGVGFATKPTVRLCASYLPMQAVLNRKPAYSPTAPLPTSSLWRTQITAAASVIDMAGREAVSRQLPLTNIVSSKEHATLSHFNLRPCSPQEARQEVPCSKDLGSPQPCRRLIVWPWVNHLIFLPLSPFIYNPRDYR